MKPSPSILKSVFFVFFGPFLPVPFRTVLPGSRSLRSSTETRSAWRAAHHRRGSEVVVGGPFGWGMVVGWGWASATVLGVKTLQVGCGNLTNSPLECSYK